MSPALRIRCQLIITTPLICLIYSPLGSRCFASRTSHDAYTHTPVALHDPSTLSAHYHAQIVGGTIKRPPQQQIKRPRCLRVALPQGLLTSSSLVTLGSEDHSLGPTP
ncbi:uncharacterized protein BDZ99DRAFT_477923 [Mytilinidion resinicola]|uniref:Uncharacterized protein n=1 Tax=Mytilinidion resinicola TaxID=574789 RepID=A0A6A6YHY9_9PEZI|nr:uncharacterized protein BDZ99DRAFT_477923 [Mytilinidion resinicola]KAF2808411.1 hypothetical protein BDZ99DRAFT_477923 [Mytilinidion resinicola]